MDENIYHLKKLIREYEEENDRLTEMSNNWDEYGDPGSDPGFQFEQGEKVNRIYNSIIEFAKGLKNV